jgi:hypothetical protein
LAVIDILQSPIVNDGYFAGCFSDFAAAGEPAALFALAASTSFLIFSRRSTTRLRLIWCRDLSPFNLDIT